MAVEAKNPGAKRAAGLAKSAKRSGTAHTSVTTLHGAGFVLHFIEKGGNVDVDRVTHIFRMTKGQLADTVGLRAATIGKAERRSAPRTQARVREMLEIIARIAAWAGGETQAMAWYRSQPIPALDGRTPEALVKAGEAAAVRDYLDHLALGSFA